MIYLLGIGHHFQCRAERPIPLRNGGLLDLVEFHEEVGRYEKYLDGLVNKLRPQFICEEECEADLLELRTHDSGAYSVAQKIASCHSIGYRFCDPDQRERYALYQENRTTEAIDERNGWPIREGEWLRRITPLLSSPILFICGADHIATFTQKQGTRAIKVKVVCKDLKP